MVIRRAQFEALSTGSKDHFARRVVTFLRSHLPKQSQPFSEEGLFAEAENQIASARSTGLKSEADLASFVVFRFMAGADFRSQPPFGAVWSSSHLDGSAKVAKTRELLAEPDLYKRA